ncbi:hydrogen peroxide-dependent heme synthase [Demequina capsici]|uniref:Coproheme decarboxylase n=1 Tax=Demequina capsici TaxID=3075620 RepID=A0AA96F9A9_9MICO|nr:MULTISPECIES: hydrogen peroxide-dependent heme synthase [unclassified Demequina]WNM25075.1 hydrogen peroxide-dependent heme synthase [Demequina sp. OYTSA14]WNM27981.1 hydrogen peroxide-dependent heme synthase [Demequina sp. PMTSA13]
MTDQPDGFTLFSVLDGLLDAPDEELAEVVEHFDMAVAELAEHDVVLRGIYDVSGLRADGTVMLWLHGPVLEDLQLALRELHATELLAGTTLTWSAAGVHRAAEFNKAHVPGFLRGERPRNWLTVYPFVRSYEWYLLPDEERSQMLREHGMKGAAFKGVVANTVAAFALGDYEWLLPMEADEVTDLVDMMRELRYTEARRHVRTELPFYTGRRVTTAEAVEVLAS